MNVKSKIAAVAISAASMAYGLTPPPVEVKTLCLSVYENNEGVKQAGTCDNARNNKTLGLPLLSNGCAENQISLSSVRYNGSKNFTIQIYSCLPPNAVQL